MKGILAMITLAAFGKIVVKYYNNIRAIILDIVRIIANITGWGKRTSIRGDIQLVANNTIKQLNNISPELQLQDMSIEWVGKDESGKVRYDASRAIVMLRFDKDMTQNVINATTAYVRQSLLPTSKPFMDNEIAKAIDFVVIRKFLLNTPQSRVAVSSFTNDNSLEIQKYQETFNQVNTTDDYGLLSRILLREYALWGNNIVTELPNEEHRKESREILNFVYNIASREFDDPTPLQYIRKNIKIAVLLVAKTETFEEAGVKPYIRRIREGFANGINTFYLLARGEKISILNKVYDNLMKTGNFVLLNSPSIFNDKNGKENICYSIQIDKTGNVAKDHNYLIECAKKRTAIDVNISHVYSDKIKGFYNLLPIVIPKSEITDEDIKLWNYYTQGMTIHAIPSENTENGSFIASIKDTDSSPRRMIDSKYFIGQTVSATFENVEDSIAYLLIEGTDMQAVAYRKDLTYCQFQFLHALFPVGTSAQFEIIDINYINNKLQLRLLDLTDPWLSFNKRKGEQIDFQIYRKDDTSFVSETSDGIRLILPYSELTWINSEIEAERKKHRLNDTIRANIKLIDKDRSIIIVTTKNKENPYVKFFKDIEEPKNIEIIIESSNQFGVLGKAKNNLSVFIPLSETHNGSYNFKYKIGEKCIVRIKEVASNGRSFIGTFKPFLVSPIDNFLKKYPINSTIKAKKIDFLSDRAARIYPNKGDFKDIFGRLYINEISDICRIQDFPALQTLLLKAPLVIKGVNHDYNSVNFSLRSLLKKNSFIIDTLTYEQSFDATIIGSMYDKYVIVVHGIWIEGYLIIEDHHNTNRTGEVVNVRLARKGDNIPEFIEDK